MHEQQLAMEEDAHGAATRPYLTFSLGGEPYAARIEEIREVIEYTGMTEVPLAPGAVPGVINLRGNVVPLLDLSVRFGRERSVATRRTSVIVVEVADEEGTQVVGIIVDGVSEAVELPDAQIEPTPSFGCSVRADFVAGLLNFEHSFVPILALSRVLCFDELTG